WPDAARMDRQALERVRVRTPAGALIPLSSLGRIEDRCAASEVRRENLRLMVPVTARLEGTGLGSAVAAVEKAIAKIELPRGYTIEVGGQRKSQRRAFLSLAEAL